MQTNSTAGKIIALLFVIVCVPIAVYGFIKQVKNNSVEINAVKETILIPYVEALQANNIQLAYDQFTTQEYKERISYEEFAQAQQDNRAEYGDIISIHSDSDILREAKEPGKPVYWRATLTYEGTQKKDIIVFEVRKIDGIFKIDKTYDAAVGGASVITEKIY